MPRGSPLLHAGWRGEFLLSPSGEVSGHCLLKFAFLQNVRVWSSVHILKEAQDSSSLLLLSSHHCSLETENQGKQDRSSAYSSTRGGEPSGSGDAHWWWSPAGAPHPGCQAAGMLVQVGEH